MKRLKLILLSSIVIACQSQERLLSPLEFDQYIKEGKGVILIDVRTKEEFNRGHISGACHIDWNGNDFEERINELDQSLTALVYCHSGLRSAKAADFLNRFTAFKNVYDLDGGIVNWEGSGLALEED